MAKRYPWYEVKWQELDLLEGYWLTLSVPVKTKGQAKSRVRKIRRSPHVVRNITIRPLMHVPES